MDNRIHQIIEILTSYSLGHFEKQLEIGDASDEIEACKAGINMLGDELRVRTISTDYFNSIFNSISEMIFMLSPQGQITDVNQAVIETLQFNKQSLVGNHFHTIQPTSKAIPFIDLEMMVTTVQTHDQDSSLLTLEKLEIPVSLRISSIRIATTGMTSFLLTARDKSQQIETENRVLRAIIDTEENVRNKVAKDLHDSIGQQIAAMHFYFSSIIEQKDKSQINLMLGEFKDNLSLMLEEVHNICFDLMPRTLAEEGLLAALSELAHQSLLRLGITFHITASADLPAMPAGLKINIYRVVQEFIGNAVRHGGAGRIWATIRQDESFLYFDLIDDGQGFDLHRTGSRGMGLQNVRSRIQSHGGELIIKSTPGIGTSYFAKIPKNALL